ncbi:MAG: hypothetical protein PUC18_13090 [Prevotellaceae bacterium]|nr:hypothetical protein [Prevotellaceae bacterium]
MNTKLDRLKKLQHTLMECKQGSVHDGEEWKVYDDMMQKVKDMLHEEYKVQGYSGVYEIKDGLAGECLYEGAELGCKFFVETLLEKHPEYKGNIIVSPLY